VKGLSTPLYFRLKGVLLSEHVSEYSIALRCINLLNARVSGISRKRELIIRTALGEKLLFHALSKTDWNAWLVALRYATTQRDVREHYVIGKRIGEGAYGSVRKAVRKSSGDIVAIKIIDRNKYNVIDKKYLSSEISIIMSVNHPSIIETYDIFDTDNKLYIVMNYVEGGTLEDRINSAGSLSEECARCIARSLLSALACLHSFGIVHRDIKTDNILCADILNKGCEVKLSDFGLGAMTKQSDESTSNVLESVIGCWFYIAPEQAKCERYGAAVDIWAAGVLIYRMLSGEYPFSGKSPGDVLCQIRAGKFNFSPAFVNISEDAKDLIRLMMEVDPHRRINALDTLQHPWLYDHELQIDVPDIRALSSLEEDRIRQHRQRSKDMDFDLNGATIVKGLAFDGDDFVEPTTTFRKTLRAFSTRMFHATHSTLPSDDIDEPASTRSSQYRMDFRKITSASLMFSRNISRRNDENFANPASPFG